MNEFNAKMSRSFFAGKPALVFLILAAAIGFVAAGSAVGAETSNPGPVVAEVLHVYCPGNLKWPLQDCADILRRTQGVQVKITAGLESQWMPQAKKNADLIVGGTESLLNESVNNNPGFLDLPTRTFLYTRSTGILVRKGNPKGIRSLADLTKPGVNILVVDFGGYMGMWEDLAGRLGLIQVIQKNIAVSAKNGSDGLKNWKNNRDLDAWISYKPWHIAYKDITDFVELPQDQRLYRGSSIVITTLSKNREWAQRFITFLKTDEAHKVFQSWGWE